MREANILLRQLGRVLVLAGAVLASAGFFAPWYRLYTAFGDTPGEQLVGPWTLLRQGASAALLPVALGVFLPVAVLVASSVTSLLFLAPQGREILATLTLLLASGCLIGALLVLAIVPQGLSLTWPYYTIRRVEYGAWVALAGFACIALGVLCLHGYQRVPLADRPHHG